MMPPTSLYVDPQYMAYVRLHDTLEPETQAWVREHWYRCVLAPTTSVAEFERKVAAYTPGQWNRMHNEALAHVVSRKPAEWRLSSLTATDSEPELVIDTPSRPPVTTTSIRPLPSNAVRAAATDLTCHLHPAGLLLCTTKELRNDKWCLYAVYDGVWVDQIVRVLWRLIYDLGSPEQTSRDSNDYRRLLRLVSDAVGKYRPLFDERYRAAWNDRHAMAPWQRERLLHLYMTAHMGDPIEVEHNIHGETMFRLAEGEHGFYLTTGILLDWVLARRNQSSGGTVVVACLDDSTARFIVDSVDDMDFVPQGGFIFRSGDVWPSRPNCDLRSPRIPRALLPVDPDDPNGGLGPLPFWAPDQIQPVVEYPRYPCPYHPEGVPCEESAD